MDKILRILHLEDELDYCEVVRGLLLQEGILAEVHPATNREEFCRLVKDEGFDLILADFLVPGFDGLTALTIAREARPDVPFIILSGTIGEQEAVASLKAGATDYVMKVCPAALGPAIRRALNEAEERSARRNLETQLVRQEKYYRALTENCLDIVTLLGAGGEFVYNSASVSRVLGYEPRELLGADAFAFIHPDDLPKAKQVFVQALQDPQRTVTLEFRVRTRSGSWRYLEAVGQNRLDDPDIAAVVINSRDINDRKHSELQFRYLFEGSPDAIFVEAFDGKVLDANPAACRLHGAIREELIGSNVTDLVPPGVRESVARDFQRMVAGEVDQLEGTSYTRDGRTVPVELRCSRVQYQGQMALLLHVRDVTDRKQLEEQLRQAQKMEAVGQLAGGVAHDFNNILTVIQGHASLLESGGRLHEQAAKSARQIIHASERAAGLTRQLLAFCRRQVMQPRRLDLNDVVANITKMLGRLLGEDIALKLHYAPRPALVLADSSMLEQVLLNLAVNARDAMPQGGSLMIRVEEAELRAPALVRRPEARPGRFLRLTVTDTGCGIAPKDLGRIFEPFFTTKGVGKGTGLGLATAYGIVKQHEGWIEVESEPGKGTTFRIFLPLASGGFAPAEENLSPRHARGGSETILLVEDESSVRELVCTLLESYGYRILKAESGPQALETWRTSRDRIDLVLTDLVMPDRMNGRELAEKLWKEQPDLKVIFTSGYSAEVVGQDYVLGGNQNYLQKPYHPHKLAAMVRACLDATN